MVEKRRGWGDAYVNSILMGIVDAMFAVAIGVRGFFFLFLRIACRFGDSCQYQIGPSTPKSLVASECILPLQSVTHRLLSNSSFSLTSLVHVTRPAIRSYRLRLREPNDYPYKQTSSISSDEQALHGTSQHSVSWTSLSSLTNHSSHAISIPPAQSPARDSNLAAREPQTQTSPAAAKHAAWTWKTVTIPAYAAAGIQYLHCYNAD